MIEELLRWLGPLAVALAVWGAVGELRVWWRLRFRSPRYFVLLLAAALAIGAALALVEYQDERRPSFYLLYLLGVPGVAVLGFLLHGGPSEYVRTHPLLLHENEVQPPTRS